MNSRRDFGRHYSVSNVCTIAQQTATLLTLLDAMGQGRLVGVLVNDKVQG